MATMVLKVAYLYLTCGAMLMVLWFWLVESTPSSGFIPSSRGLATPTQPGPLSAPCKGLTFQALSQAPSGGN